MQQLITAMTICVLMFSPVFAEQVAKASLQDDETLETYVIPISESVDHSFRKLIEKYLKDCEEPLSELFLSVGICKPRGASWKLDSKKNSVVIKNTHPNALLTAQVLSMIARDDRENKLDVAKLAKDFGLLRDGDSCW